jgi:rhomboid protease GluP
MENTTRDKLSIFIKFHPITSLILVINLMMVFVIIYLGGFKYENLIYLGGIRPDYVIEFNQWYRLFTAMFLHGSIIHFLGNSLVLFYLGSHLERLIGSLRFTILYFLSGTISSLAVVYFGGYRVLTIGASGAIFGIVGGLLLLTFIKKTWFTPQSIKSIRQLVVINLVLTFVVPFISIPGHIGGFIVGLTVFYFMIPSEPDYQKKIAKIREDFYNKQQQDAKKDDDSTFMM